MIHGGCLCGGVRFEIAAGLLDDDPKLRPDKHIFVERKADWYEITDALPQLDKVTLVNLRAEHGPHASPEASS